MTPKVKSRSSCCQGRDHCAPRPPITVGPIRATAPGPQVHRAGPSSRLPTAQQGHKPRLRCPQVYPEGHPLPHTHLAILTEHSPTGKTAPLTVPGAGLPPSPRGGGSLHPHRRLEPATHSPGVHGVVDLPGRRPANGRLGAEHTRVDVPPGPATDWGLGLAVSGPTPLPALSALDQDHL